MKENDHVHPPPSLAHLIRGEIALIILLGPFGISDAECSSSPSDVRLDFVAFPSRVSKQVKRSLPMTFGNLTTQPFFCTSVGKASEIS